MNSPFVLVIFGATGDLAQHKLIPSLFSLFQKKQLPEDFYIFGFSRREFSDEDFRGYFKPKTRHPELDSGSQKLDPGSEAGMTEKEMWAKFISHLFYQQGNFDDPKGYTDLIPKLEALDKKMGACITRIFYLATPPQNYETILDHLKSTKLSEGCGQGSNKWTRVAIEKPFGKDVATSKMLDDKLSTIFQEEQIFRVDHYLGKETVQNMLVFRFANSIFEPVWNKEYIDHVQITFAEKKGIETRGKFYDGVGILRDVGQNHLMQILAAVTMDMPTSFSKEGVRDARAKALANLQCIEPEKVSENVFRGQYVGYRKEKDVDPASTTETYVAMKFFVNSPRFEYVPFYIRAGIEMPENVVEVSLVFKQTCHILFKEIGCPEEGNILTIRIQPDEGISIKMIAKTPGSKLALGSVNMHFSYQEEFGKQGIDAYEKVLLDVFSGDQMLFNRSDELSSTWEFIENILKGWQMSKDMPLVYEEGTWGPKEAEELIEKDGRKWIK